MIEITKEETKFVPVRDETRLVGAFLVGVFLGLLFARKQRTPNGQTVRSQKASR